MKSIYIETYGCSANQSHSEVMAGILEDNGFSVTERIEKADVIVINTCIVKTPTENRIRDRIRFIRNKYPRKKLVIAGCATDGEYRIFRKLAPDAVFLSSHNSKDIAGLLSKETKETKRKIRINPLVGITEIASGCLGKCAYCIVKLARGDLKSKNLKEIERSIRDSLKDGCKEIWITSQDCGCYGLDIETNLAKLLEGIVRIKGDFHIRVGMMNPTHIKPILKELIRVYENPKIYKFIHIPVQSGSDKVLEKMKRGYKTKDFERIVNMFRRKFPSITLSTDIIVGFPGETEKDFGKSLDLIKRIKPDIVNISKFSPRPKTAASRMRRVDNKVVKGRSKLMAEIVKETGFERNKKLIGNECPVLVNEKGKRKNQFMGRNESYKPVILTDRKNLMGKLLRVRITSAGRTYLTGEILDR
ncbi:MAG: tRNA (N(6)-L-threonylcarbamoyladenosine(37)-C(2))-methylthiotransferase [Candidatus Aenigmarchaeota archaeon]|nr:tRNA (N(6)-L-threonylcarbamoyladenosine(37)-C(2))-methylthiotransferase [Candidatus Aenigmarchaeota archaeon]NIP40140.1 tRNA (N(6)-L-threonylcarbamoyladenosine(37)-C(2))-methylthiotransferase [Candidatus Aenigmarchaeota archaeon]NIQ18217.1 tRNA (N(6)-L-threonylcarbamoyladenosine(37)-C(2))-methylthiotransferase [Candidatus Aenigmarchaeota archaeon]NIS72974.1 tRNA (N(6)-L-threonylcarbamoyladenosine(37)-C(2))-methylthiotransferase [Candidatus Aenigmarchaeota archaeon]